MSPQPKQIADTKKYQGYQAYWAAIHDAAQHNGTFTLRCIDDRCNTHKRTIRQYVNSLRLAGYIAVIGTTQNNANVFQLVRKPSEAPRLRKDGTHVIQGKGREQIWRVMQMQKEFTKTDLVVLASTDDTSVTSTAVKEYLTYLQRAGYLRLVRKSVPGTPARYRLKPDMNTGPKAPMLQRVKAVYDPNLKKIMWGEEQHA